MNIKTYDIAIVLGSFHKKEMEQMLVFATDEAKKYSLKIIQGSLGTRFYGKAASCKKTTFK